MLPVLRDVASASSLTGLPKSWTVIDSPQGSYCSGYQVDETNSLLTWFAEIAIEVDDPGRDPRTCQASTPITFRAGISAMVLMRRISALCRG